MWIYASTPPNAFMVQLVKHRDNFTFFTFILQYSAANKQISTMSKDKQYNLGLESIHTSTIGHVRSRDHDRILEFGEEV
jgi:hypothetical protein